MIKKSLRCLKNILTPTYVAKPGQLPPSWIPYKDYIEIHPTALIAPSATVQFYNLPKTPRPMLKIGPMSHIFGHFAFLRDTSEIKIGERCQIGSSHIISAMNITIGNDVLMAWGITVMDSDTHSKDWTHRKNDVLASYQDYLLNPCNITASKDWQNVPCTPVSVGDRCWIGFNAIILKGVSLGPETIVGAGSVLRKSTTGNCTVAGNPASLIE